MALYVAATTFPGGTFIPWHPIMVDLDVYRRAGSVLLAGGNYHELPGRCSFSTRHSQRSWRCRWRCCRHPWFRSAGLQLARWRLSRSCTASASPAGGSVWQVPPPCTSSSLLSKRWPSDSSGSSWWRSSSWTWSLVLGCFLGGCYPKGSTAVAAAIKLTAIFVVYLLLVRKFRAFWVAVITGVVVTLASAAMVPAASYEFWTRLARGDTGLGHSIIYYTNQSVMADIVRAFGVGPEPAAVGLALSAIVAVAGVWAAVLWHRLGDVRLAVNLCGLAGLLASPVSWLHHFVWVVPLAMSLLERRPISRRSLPTWYLALGWLFVVWVVLAPFTGLPNGADVELQWTWSQHLLASITTLIGLALLAGAITIAWPRVRTIFARPDTKAIASSR